MKTRIAILLCLAFLSTACTPGAAELPAPTATIEPADLPAPTTAVEPVDLPVQTATTEPADLPAPTAEAEDSSISYSENGANIRLSFDLALTGPVEEELVQAVAYSPDQMASLAHPAYVQLRFPEFAKDQTFQLPYPLDVPQMLVYRTQDFAEIGDELSQVTYPNQFSRLNDLLEKGIDPGNCAAAFSEEYQALPFLPVINSAQLFCAKAQPVAFKGGKGIRYVTYYAQGIEPASEWSVFYTFQGLSDDGQFYLSAILPIQTNLLAAEPADPGANPDMEALKASLRDQAAQIDAQADDKFTPSLSMLDGLIAGVSISGE